MTQASSSLRPIKYTGSKTTKWFKGYSWTASGTTWVTRAVATDCLLHPDIFEIDAAVDFNGPLNVTFVAASAGTSICEVTITVKDATGATIAAPTNLEIWLSDAATGVGLTATAASGTVAAKAASGLDLEIMVAKKAINVQTLATGVYILEITDTAKTGFYVCAALPGSGKAKISAVLVTGNYG